MGGRGGGTFGLPEASVSDAEAKALVETGRLDAASRASKDLGVSKPGAVSPNLQVGTASDFEAAETCRD